MDVAILGVETAARRLAGASAAARPSVALAGRDANAVFDAIDDLAAAVSRAESFLDRIGLASLVVGVTQGSVGDRLGRRHTDPPGYR